MRPYLSLLALLSLCACKKKDAVTNDTPTTEVITCNRTAMEVRFSGFAADELDTVILKDYKEDNTFSNSPSVQQLNGLAVDSIYGTHTVISNVLLNANLYKDYYYDIYIPATGKNYRIAKLYDDKETETITNSGKSGHYICYTHPAYGVVNNDTTLFEHISNSAGYTHAYLIIKK